MHVLDVGNYEFVVTENVSTFTETINIVAMYYDLLNIATTKNESGKFIGFFRSTCEIKNVSARTTYKTG